MTEEGRRYFEPRPSPSRASGSAFDPIASSAPLTPAGLQAQLGLGESLHAATQDKFERGFGHSFSNVRVHTDENAAKLASTMSARAFTVGQHVAFASGEYRPGTPSGDRLIAHELAHTVQQERSRSSVMPKGRAHDGHERAADAAAVLVSDLGFPIGAFGAQLGAAGAAPAVQMQPAGVDTTSDNPNAIVCTLLCYIGIPTPLWKHLIDMFLRAVWEDYKARAPSEEEAKKQYAAYRIALRGYGFFNVLKFVLSFMMTGEIAGRMFTGALAGAIREAMIKQAVKLGAEIAALELAEQAVRKISLIVEGAIFANCAVYCTAEAYAKAMVEFGGALAEGLSATESILAGIGSAAQNFTGGVIASALLNARATVDPVNWDTSPMPSPTNADFRAVGWYLWNELSVKDLNGFIVNVAKPISAYSIPNDLLSALAAGMQSAVNARKGFQVMFTPDLIRGMSLLQLVQFMVDWRLLKFKRDPSVIAAEEMASTAP